VDEGEEGRIVSTPAREEVDDGPESLKAFNVNGRRVVRWLIGSDGVLVKTAISEEVGSGRKSR
jgi:hypothetical protein